MSPTKCTQSSVWFQQGLPTEMSPHPVPWLRTPREASAIRGARTVLAPRRTPWGQGRQGICPDLLVPSVTWTGPAQTLHIQPSVSPHVSEPTGLLVTQEPPSLSACSSESLLASKLRLPAGHLGLHQHFELRLFSAVGLESMILI